jgi:hypothetical protein
MAGLQANVTVNFVSRVELAVQALISKNALHLRTGVRTAEATWADIIPHLVSEVREFNLALADCKKDEWKCPAVEEELADMYGILVHAVLKAGYSMEQIETCCLHKFVERFENATLIHNGSGATLGFAVRSPAPKIIEADTKPEGGKEGC